MNCVLTDPARKMSEARGQPRSSLFLNAVLRVEAERASVKVRNMSPTGAMLETPLKLIPGTQVHLIRGNLLTKARVIWSSKNSCGLKFSSEVSVAEWLAAPTKPAQQRVDQIVALVKAGAIVPGVADLAANVPFEGPRTWPELLEDLQTIVRLMEDLEDDLANSNETLARHGLKLQNLDIATQMVRAVAREVAPTQSGAPAELARLKDLRTVAAQALAIC